MGNNGNGTGSNYESLAGILGLKSKSSGTRGKDYNLPERFKP